MNDLTVSNIERQNVLNNKYAIANIQNSLGITGMLFEEEYRFTKKMVADFYEVDERLYFGEMTFTHGNGFEKFTPAEWNYKLGSLWPFDNTVRQQVLANSSRP